MKKTIFFLLFSMTLFAQAPTSFQYGVRTPTLFPWNGTNKIDVNGRLKLNTTAGGLIPPQLTTTQRLAIASPETGESVYDVTLGKYYHWDGSSWVVSGGGDFLPLAGGAMDSESLITIPNTASGDYVELSPESFTFYSGDFVSQYGASQYNLVNTSTNEGITFEPGLMQITGTAGNVTVRSDNLTTDYTVRYPDDFSGTNEVYAMRSDLVGLGTPTLTEHQIPFGQVGDVFGSDSTLTYEGGTLSINGVDALTTANGQTLDSDLTDISSLAPPNDNILQRKAGAWTSRTPAQLKTDLSLEKADVGLSNVDNTSDVNKPVSTAVSTEYNSASALTFSGPIDLSKKGGSYYAEHTQTGAITFSVSATTVGGLAQVTIIANGNAINLVGGWINVGGEPVSTVSGTTNYMVVWQTNNKVFYSVKVY